MKKKVKAEDRYKEFLYTYSTFYEKNLTDKEIGVVDALYWKGGVLSSEVRKAIQEELKITEFNLNNYLYKLRGKGLIVACEDGKSECLLKTLMVDVKTDKPEFGFLFILQS